MLRPIQSRAHCGPTRLVPAVVLQLPLLERAARIATQTVDGPSAFQMDAVSIMLDIEWAAEELRKRIDELILQAVLKEITGR